MILQLRLCGQVLGPVRFLRQTLHTAKLHANLSGYMQEVLGNEHDPELFNPEANSR